MKYVALAVMGLTLIAGPALAEFEVEEATTASQKVEMELNNAVRVGGVTLGESVSEHEIGVNYGALEFWEVGLGFEVENERGSQVSPETFFVQTKLAILGGETAPGEQFFDMAIFTEVSFDLGSSNDSTLSVGPIFGFNFDQFSIVTNSFFQVPLADSSADTGFLYAVGAMVDLNENIAIGLEAHGEVDSIIAGAPSLESQEHYIGPAIELSFEPEEGREVELRLGSFFGLTTATSDLGLSANLELGF